MTSISHEHAQSYWLCTSFFYILEDGGIKSIANAGNFFVSKFTQSYHDTLKQNNSCFYCVYNYIFALSESTNK